MSLPPGFLDDLRTRLSLVQVVGRKVMWDKRKSQPGKGDMWAPCPFHHEKTASFHVDDRKGYYYCFGCHAKGDAISFVRETENVSFMEAVEMLATEASMEMPARDPRAQEKADRRTVLSEVMEQAVQFFRLQLKTQGAAQARTYLADKRKLDAGALDRFEIGFAPPGWDNLRLALTGKGVPVDLLIACGLVKASDKGREPYDVFRNRIMFPIRDARGRAIAFGGRAMDPDDNAKYLNSPETELFDKSRNLYNLRPAREAVGKGQPLIVAEGYMDVIALSEAGFTGAVAPLGTAVTEAQLQLMWRLGPEPIIALDGDKAGLRAAYRVIDLALPLLEAGRSLRFALMPDGQDPDDLLRAKGPGAVQACLDAAMPLVDLLWRHETEGKTFDSPERKAALDKDLRARIAKIQDPGLRHHYGMAIKELRYHLFRPQRAAQGRAWQPRRPWNAPEPPSATAKASHVAQGLGPGDGPLRDSEALVLLILCRYPDLIDAFEPHIARFEPSDTHLRDIRDILLDCMDRPEDVPSRLAAQIGSADLEELYQKRHIAVVPCLRAARDRSFVVKTIEAELTKVDAHRGWHVELQEAEADLEADADEVLTWRLAQAAKARAQAGRLRDDTEVDFELGENGAHIDREERSAFDSLLSSIRFDKDRS